MKSVAIIGAGITGLTAAYKLRQKGITVTVFEAANRVGGVIQSVRQDGFLAECGPNSILETSPKIKDLVRDLGLESRRQYGDEGAGNRYLVRGGRPVSLPTSLPGFLRTPLFSFGAKMRLFREPFISRSASDAEESVGEFVVRRLGAEFLEYAIDPLVAGVYAGDPRRLSVRQAFPKLLAVEQKYGSLIRGQILGARERKRSGEVSKQSAPKVSFDEGLQVLVDRLGEQLDGAVRLGCPVQTLQATASGWVVSASGKGEADDTEYGAVFYAGTAHGLARLQIQNEGMPSLTPLADVFHPPVASIVLGFRREDVAHPLDGFGMLIPRVEGFRILGTIFSSSLFSGRAPAGCVTLTSYMGGARQPDLALKSAKEQTAMTLEDLQKLLGVKGSPVFEHHFLYRQAIPQYDVNFGKMRELMTQAETAAPGLFLGGHYRDGISLGDSIVAGHNAADRISAYLGQVATQPGRTGQISRISA